MRKPKKHIQHHHVFIIAFSVVAILFAGNVFAINTIHKQITNTTLAEGTTPIIFSRDTETRAGDTIKSNPDSILLPLASTIQNVTSKYTTNFAVSIQNLQTGDYIGVNDGDVMKSASLYKLFVGLEVLRLVDDGSLSLSNYHGQYTIEECLERMLSYSDNECGRSLRKLINADAKNSNELVNLGYIDTNISGEYPVTSSRDIAKLYDDLYNQRHLQANSNQLFLEFLFNQQTNDRIPLAVPAEMQIAHKTGDLEGYSHDAGILYTDFGNYSITIMTGPWPNGYLDAPGAIIELTREIYNWITLNS